MKETVGRDHPIKKGKPITREGSTPKVKNDEYLFVSAGIRERPGRIPIWLVMVAFGLCVWGSYYLVTYWNPS